MSVICIANLKGGVGKSTVAVNAAAALAQRGCETLLIDCDIQGSTNLLTGIAEFSEELGQQLKDFLQSGESSQPMFERVVQFCQRNCREITTSLSVLPLAAIFGGVNLEGVDPSSRQRLLAEIISEMTSAYDYIVVDTAPHMDALLQATVEIASLLMIPVDPSAFSVKGAQRLLQHIEPRKDQVCLLLRTLVQTRASRVARQSLSALATEEKDLSALQQIVPFKKIAMKGVPSWQDNGVQLFLSGVVIPRSEQMHRLSFRQQTVFDSRELQLLQERFKGLAHEIEAVLEFCDQSSEVENDDSLSAFILGSI